MLYLIFRKFLLGGLIVSVPVLTVAFSSQSSSINMFSFDGSSSMKETMEKILLTFEKGDIELNIQTSGSHAGIQKLLKKESDFALISLDVEEVAKAHKEWKEQKIKVITLAQDPIVLLYKKPDGCNQTMTLDKDKFKKIYSLFSGHTTKDVTDDFKDLMNGNDAKCSVTTTSFARTGGAKKSGTAYSFLYSNPLWKTIESEMNNDNNGGAEWIKKVKSSDYGKNFLIKFTPESNSLALKNFLSDLTPGSMIYLSGSFVFSNWDQIQKAGLEIAEYKSTGDSTGNALTKNNLTNNTNKYAWVRNFNIAYSTDNLSQKKKDLITKITKKTLALKDINLIPITYSTSTSDSNSKQMKDDKLFDVEEDCNQYGFTKATCDLNTKK